MLITKVSRTYSRSVNTKSFSQSAPESWVKVVASYDAEIESTDKPDVVSAAVYEMCRTDVTAGIRLLGEQINAAFNKQTVSTVNTPPTVDQNNSATPRQL